MSIEYIMALLIWRCCCEVVVGHRGGQRRSCCTACGRTRTLPSHGVVMRLQIGWVANVNTRPMGNSTRDSSRLLWSLAMLKGSGRGALGRAAAFFLCGLRPHENAALSRRSNTSPDLLGGQCQ